VHRLREVFARLPIGPGHSQTRTDPQLGVHGMHGMHCFMPVGRSPSILATARQNAGAGTAEVPSRGDSVGDDSIARVDLLWCGSFRAGNKSLADKRAERGVPAIGAER